MRRALIPVGANLIAVLTLAVPVLGAHCAISVSPATATVGTTVTVTVTGLHPPGHVIVTATSESEDLHNQTADTETLTFSITPAAAGSYEASVQDHSPGGAGCEATATYEVTAASQPAATPQPTAAPGSVPNVAMPLPTPSFPPTVVLGVLLVGSAVVLYGRRRSAV